jgi:hypothetical protein
MNKRTLIVLSILIISSTPLYAVENGTWVMQTIDTQGNPVSPSLAIDSTGKPRIVYYDQTGQKLKSAVWNGTQWILSVIVNGYYASPQMVLDSHNNRHIAFYDVNSHKSAYYGPCSPIIPFGSNGRISIALDSDGNPHISDVANSTGGNLTHIYFDGTAWVKETVDTTDNSWTTSIKIGSNNIPHIAYRHYFTGDNQLAYAVYDPASWNWSHSMVDSTVGSGLYISLALDSGGKPNIAYFVENTNYYDLRYAKFDGISWSIQEVDTAGDVGRYVSLALDASDRPHISYLDQTNGALKYAYYDGSLWHTEIVDARGDRTGVSTSLALDSTGNPCIAYIDSFNKQLRYAYVVPNEPATPPIADAGYDQNIMDADDNGTEQVTLDGSGSTDPDGSIVNYVWREGGNQIATGVNPTVTLSVGTHFITLTVTDDDGLTDANTVTVTIETFSNQSPVANAGGPYTIYVGDTLMLDASGSTDEHNNIVSYLWDLDDNNSFETDAGSNAVFDINYACLQSLGLLIGNTYKIHLKVTDSGGLSNIASSTLTIIPTPALLVIVDIKPGSCPNPLNVKSSGVLPVAILGTADFDVTTIDATSIRLAGVSPLRSSIEDIGGPANDSNDCNCTEDGPDGLADLTLKFKTERIVEAIGDVNEGDVLTLELAGVLIGERPIEGADCVVVGGKHKPCNKFDINEDGVVDYSDFCEFAQNWMKSSIVED